MPEPIIKIQDCRDAGHCVDGVRKWFKRHDLDFRDFMKNGIPADDMEAVGDALGIAVVRRASRQRGT